MEQISMFDGSEPLRLTNPIRLIELFAGIGAQARALEKLGANFEHYKICEFDKYAVASYNAVHGTHFEPSDITKIHATDLGIVERDKYDYILTYSFPCTDLSLAGKQQGMQRGSGTRSGLLWEVERLLKECGDNLPQVLLMENVTQVHGTANKDDFDEWVNFLYGLGYNSKWFDLNAKDFGVPQNRDRCFMISWLGDHYYNTPKGGELKLRLKDLLEAEVDEKYYLSDEAINRLDGGIGVELSRTIRSGGKSSYDGKHSHDIVAKPIILQRSHGYNKGGVIGDVSTSVTTSSWVENNYCANPIIYDDFNGQIKSDQSCIGTLTTNCGNDAPRNGVKIMLPIGLPIKQATKDGVAICVDGGAFNMQYYGSETRRGRVIENGTICPTLEANSNEIGVVCKVLFELEGGKYDSQLDMHKRVFDTDGLSPAITTFGGGNTEKKVAIPITQLYEQAKALYPNRGIWEHNGILYWVRKLTPRECWRLMGFDDADFDRACKVNSNAQLYKQAGNSIVVNVLMAILEFVVG